MRPISEIIETLRTNPAGKAESELDDYIWRKETKIRMKDAGLPDRFIERHGFDAHKAQRAVFRAALRLCSSRGAIVALVGPRGTGKTTIAAQMIRQRAECEALPPWERQPPYRKAADLLNRWNRSTGFWNDRHGRNAVPARRILPHQLSRFGRRGSRMRRPEGQGSYAHGHLRPMLLESNRHRADFQPDAGAIPQDHEREYSFPNPGARSDHRNVPGNRSEPSKNHERLQNPMARMPPTLRRTPRKGHLRSPRCHQWTTLALCPECMEKSNERQRVKNGWRKRNFPGNPPGAVENQKIETKTT